MSKINGEKIHEMPHLPVTHFSLAVSSFTAHIQQEKKTHIKTTDPHEASASIHIYW